MSIMCPQIYFYILTHLESCAPADSDPTTISDTYCRRQGQTPKRSVARVVKAKTPVVNGRAISFAPPRFLMTSSLHFKYQAREQIADTSGNNTTNVSATTSLVEETILLGGSARRLIVYSRSLFSFKL